MTASFLVVLEVLFAVLGISIVSNASSRSFPATLQNLLLLLRSYKAQGYFIVGLEQTSSSQSLNGFTFPDQPILLLLGKEKEGIPVEFLQAVDQCLEVPQLGIIRSLNVHVSGAIALWEYTKQRLGQQKE